MSIGLCTSLRADLARAQKIAETLCEAFYNSRSGIRGETVETSWQKNRPRGMKTGSRERLLFIALTSGVDRQRDAIALWAGRAKPAFESAQDRWLFDPENVVRAGIDKLGKRLRALGISQKHEADAKAWCTICETFVEKWGGDPRNFLRACKYHAPTVLDRLINDKHRSRQDGRNVRDHPQLRGRKIGPMFLRFLRDWAHVKLTDLDEIPIPVDIQAPQISQASMTPGSDLTAAQTAGSMRNLPGIAISTS